MKRRTCLITCLILLVFALCLIALRGRGEVEPAVFYRETLAKISAPQRPGLRHFPREVPEGAQEVKVFYQPRIGQGGAVFTLCYKQDAKAREHLSATFTPYATWQGNVSPHTDLREMGVLEESLSPLLDEKGKLPADLMLYVLYSKPHRPDDWNHGQTGLFATSEEQGLVLYAYENW